MSSQHDLVARQFGSNAELYARSTTHNDSAVLEDLMRILKPQPHELALDIATGPGTVALVLAPRVKKVYALDLTEGMLVQAKKRAIEAGYKNLEVRQAPAELLPFEANTFDVVTVRTAPHHFAHVQQAVGEMARVLKPGGRALIVDTSSPEDPDLDAELNEIEKVRDPSHVRNYTLREWRSMLAEVGLEIEYEREHSHALGKRLLFHEWVTRMNVGDEDVAHLRNRFENAGSKLRELMQFVALEGGDYSFTLPEITILARKA